MPYIKVISIKDSVAGCLNYIANPDKTEERTLLTGINTSEDLNEALQDFKLTYEVCSHKSFSAKPLSGKSPVKAFHLVQSFAAGECSAETAHKIGVEWIQKAFGSDYQVVVTTHVDTEHIHNHFLLCPYDLNGKKFNSNKASVDRVRKVSDAICRQYGIGEMEKLLSKADHKPYAICYGEWLHRKRGTSWKARISEYIDSLIPLSKNLDHLLQIMEAHGYKVKRGCYISVRAPEQKKSVRLKTLGAEYAEAALAERIQEYLDAQPKPRTLNEIFELLQREFKRETRNICFAARVKDTTELLCKQLALINNEHISSVGEAEQLLENAQKRITELETAITNLSAEAQHKQIVAAAAERFFGKHKFGEYPNAQRKSDKLILARAGITAITEVSGYADDVAVDSGRLTEMQAELEEQKKREAVLRGIIKTYGERDDYITKLVKATREKLDKQEQARVKALQEQEYAVYRYQEQYLPPEKCNIDDCTKIYERSLFDVNADPDSLGEMLNGIVAENNLYRGDIIYLNNTAYHIGEWEFTKIPDFMQSRAEAEHQRQEELAKQEQERIAAEERRRQQEEEQRRLEEQKKQKEEETTKSVKPKRNRGLH